MPNFAELHEFEAFLNARLEHHESSGLKGRKSATAILEEKLKQNPHESYSQVKA